MDGELICNVRSTVTVILRKNIERLHTVVRIVY